MEKSCETCRYCGAPLETRVVATGPYKFTKDRCIGCMAADWKNWHSKWPQEPEITPNARTREQEQLASMYEAALGPARGPSTPPERVRILNEAARLTGADRNKTYGDPGVNLACAGELKDVFWRYAKANPREISPAEGEALDQVMTKLARLATGAAKLDNYIDGAAYFAIAGEVCNGQSV